MTKLRSIALGVIVASTLLALTAGTANALRSISINEKSISVMWRGVNFREPVFGFSITCPVTMNFVFNENKISKTATEIGNVVAISFAEASCTGGTGRPLATTPWIILYNGFTGTLPIILTIRFLIRRVDLLFVCIICSALYEGAWEGRARITGGAFSSFEMETGRVIPLKTLLTGSAPSGIRDEGTATVVRQRDGLGGVTVTLI